MSLLKPFRQQIRCLILLTTLVLSSFATAEALPVLTNLLQEKATAGSHRFLLVLVSQPGCSYCTLIEDEILKPMQISGNYDKQLLIRNLIIHDDRSIIDAMGIPLDATGFARRYKTSLTPTLLFLDPMTGDELAPKMVGVTTIEMYGYYVDKAIIKASKQLIAQH